MVYMSTMPSRGGKYGDTKNSHTGYGRVGATQQMVFTKDKMGFDLEVIERCGKHEGKCIDTVYKHRRHDKRAADELSGETQKRAKAEVTLPKFSWDEED